MAKNRITFTDDFVLRNEKVGIGTTNPDANLTTFGTVRFGGTTQNSNFYVANTGYVGFGTTNPTNSVEFVESVRFSAIGATSTEKVNLVPYLEQNGALSFENSNYATQHLSVTNEETDVLFVVNDINANAYLQVSNAGITSIRDGEFRSLKGVAVGATEAEKVSLNPYKEESGALSFENANYETQHFSVTNSPSNILFSINDENANSIFEVTNTGVVTFTDGNFRKFSGVAVGATASEIITMLPYTEQSGSLSFENITGEYQHLSLTNETGGDIFAVNDDNGEAVLAVSNSGVVHSGITTIGLTTTATSPTVNASMSFELTDNTTLTIRVKGTDGTIRTGIVTLS